MVRSLPGMDRHFQQHDASNPTCTDVSLAKPVDSNPHEGSPHRISCPVGFLNFSPKASTRYSQGGSDVGEEANTG